MKRLIVFVLAITFTLFNYSSVSANTNSLQVSEVMTTGCISFNEGGTNCQEKAPREEFIEIYNPLAIDVDLTGVRLQYINSGGTISDLVIFEGSIKASSYILATSIFATSLGISSDINFIDSGSTSSGKLAESGGQIRLFDSNTQTTIDHLSWGSAPVVGAWPKVPVISAGYSIKRILPGDPLFGFGSVFTNSTLPLTPMSGGLIALEPPIEEDPEHDPNEEISLCDKILITEVLPNPSGSDSGKEFVELYNPSSEDINLAGCKLQVSQKTFTFPYFIIEANSYKVISDQDIGFSLPNSSGAKLIFISKSNVELMEVNYPGDTKDNQAWAWFGGDIWKLTFHSTPSEPNIFQQFLPCPTGQVRNPDTGRCRNVEAASNQPKPCEPGQARNPETNRCRKINTLAATLTPCKPGQYRNPDTNRCRLITSLASTLKPCKIGQERNPETNRCRNVVINNPKNLANVVDIDSTPGNLPVGWIMAVVSIIFAFGYGVYEWRTEIINIIKKS